MSAKCKTECPNFWLTTTLIMTQLFQIVFNVPMECQSCVDSVNHALESLKGLENIEVDLSTETVTVVGCLPPSEIVKKIRETGKDAIIRGTGKPNSAAVCILESFDPNDFERPVKGLARFVAVGDDELLVDLTVNGLPKGTYYPLIRTSGNLSEGAYSTGGIFHPFAPIEVDQLSDISTKISSIGAFSQSTSELCSGQSFLQAKLKIHELIGRSMVLSKLKTEISSDALCGVIARSAGAWENDKSVCSCTGKTVWQERVDAVNRGVTS